MIEAFETQHEVTVVHAWGMTETSPIGTVGVMKSAMMHKPLEQQLPYKVKQGRAVYGVDLKIVDETGKELPRDGVAFGSLLCAAPGSRAATSRARAARSWTTTDGSIPATWPRSIPKASCRSRIAPRISSRAAAEWISSIELENVAVGHADIQEAAVIGMPHDKWGERPVVVAIRREGSALSREDLLAFMSDKVARWSIPDDVVFVEELPHTATGKLSKLTSVSNSPTTSGLHEANFSRPRIAAIGKASSPCLEISRCRTPTNRHFAVRIFGRNQIDIDPR